MMRLCLALAAFCVFSVLLSAPNRAGAGVVITYAVDTTLDDATKCTTAVDDCSLRGAITDANANPGAVITFGISSGLQTIAVGIPLPTVTAPTFIDGTTQPGFSGTPLIEINGNSKPDRA